MFCFADLVTYYLIKYTSYVPTTWLLAHALCFRVKSGSLGLAQIVTRVYANSCIWFYFSIVIIPQIRYDKKLEKSQKKQINAERQQLYKKGTLQCIPL